MDLTPNYRLPSDTGKLAHSSSRLDASIEQANWSRWSADNKSDFAQYLE
jgi:hypothetical protein